MRKSFSLLVAAAAVAGSIATAAPAQAWTCHIGGVVPQEVGEAVCDTFLAVVGAACKVLPGPCVQ